MKKISVLIAAIAFTACQSDWRDGIPPSDTSITWSDQAVTFSTTVSSSQQPTRADATIVNIGETTLLPTATSNRKVGIFGCYTGKYTWAELVALSQKADPTDAEKEILNKYYSAGLMFNVPADINDNGTLTYTPLQFWSNNPLPSPSTGHEYMTFWAYYPYNESSTLGEYGISMFNDENGIGPGKGMGKVKFTMHADASKHNDFLISAPAVDCNRDKYTLQRTDNTPSYEPKPVQFRLYHMLAQVRFYVFINGNDKMVYKANPAVAADLESAEKKYFRKSDGLTSIVPEGGWLQVGDVVNSVTITTENISTYADQKPAVMDEYGTWVELKVGDQIPNESQCVRWKRSDVWNLNHTSRRPEITYTMELNNIHTTSTFYPRYTDSGATIAYDEATTLGSTSVNHYIMNPYWFTFKDGVRERLNDNYMFGYYEDTPVAKQYNATNQKTLDAAVGAGTKYDDYDGWNWTDLDDPLDYLRLTPSEFLTELEGNRDDSWKDPSDHSKGHKHYNYAPANIMLVVPQKLSDDDVPHVVITAHGRNAADTEDLTAKVTVNLLKMGISWESGYIYCYAFLDELRPGDDKVRGPESITTLFNKEWRTDQW